MTCASKVDFWALRAKQNLPAIEQALAVAFDGAAPVTLKARPGGWKGYEESAEVLLGEMGVGLVAWGGSSQKGWAYVGISGRGCEWVSDWDRAQEVAGELDGYELKRVDIALDRFDPEGFDKCLEAYRNCGFAPAGQGGRPPKCQTVRSERDEDGSTIYVGSRERDKFFRGYEKGRQVLGPEVVAAERKEEQDGGKAMRAAMGTLMRGVGADGTERLYPLRDWFRYELELKPKTAPLPEDVIDRRDQYFAGAYPYLQTVLADVDAEALVMRRDRGPQLDLARALCGVQRQYGDTLFTALVAFHGDIGAVWERVCGKKHNASLTRAGVLLVEHGEDAL